MPQQENAVKRHALASPSGVSTSQQPATIADLSPEVLLRTLALTGQPARYASVCSRWNDVLAGNSEVWRVCVLTNTLSQLEDTATLLKSLRRRCMSIESVTFRGYMMSRDHNPGNGDHRAFCATFFGSAMGMLAAGSPLCSLRFEGCSIASNILPQLRLLASCTALHLDKLDRDAECYVQLSELFKALPQLRDVSAIYCSTRAAQDAVPIGLAACSQLQCCQLVDLNEHPRAMILPDCISCLTSLTTLCMGGIYVDKVSASLGQLTALQTLRMPVYLSRNHGMDPLQLPLETAQLASSLRRLSFCSKAVPAELTALQSLSRLSIGRLTWTQDVGSQVEGLSVLTNIASLRVHHCYGLQNTWRGLYVLLLALPKLEALALDHNNMTQAVLGHAAQRLTSLNLRGSAFAEEGLPEDLRYAVNCRILQLTVKSWDALTKGGTQPVLSCPVLQMSVLETLVLHQPTWQHGDVEALLALQRCIHEVCADCGDPFPIIVCPAKPDMHAHWEGGALLAESSDDEGDI